MSDRKVPEGLSRSEFLKVAGLASLGALAAGVSRAHAAGEKPERLYVVTHADDDADRAALALILASLDAKKIGKENAGVTVWFTLQGARLCRKGAAGKITSPVFKKLGTLADILGSATKAGAKVAACPFCLDALDLKKSEYIAGLERKGGDYVAAQVGKADVIWM